MMCLVALLGNLSLLPCSLLFGGVNGVGFLTSRIRTLLNFLVLPCRKATQWVLLSWPFGLGSVGCMLNGSVALYFMCSRVSMSMIVLLGFLELGLCLKDTIIGVNGLRLLVCVKIRPKLLLLLLLLLGGPHYAVNCRMLQTLTLSCLVLVVWPVDVGCSLVKLLVLMRVVKPWPCLLAFVFLLNVTWEFVASLLFLKWLMVGLLVRPLWLCASACGVWYMLAVAAFVLRRLGCVLRCLAAACIWMSCLLHSSSEFFLACSGHVTLFGLTLLDLQRMLSILGCCPTLGLAPLNGNGIMVILACGLTSPLRVTPDSVNMSCVMLGVLGVCVGTWLRTGVILSLIVLMVVGISGVLTGMLLDCLLRRARLLVRWFAVLRFPQLLSVVGSLLTLPPLAFGTTAPNLARLIMLLGNVSIVLVLSLNLPSFCLLGMVGLWRIRVLTLLWCKVGWSRCNSQSGLLCTSKWRLCSFAWSGYLACFGFARVHPPLRLSRFRWLPLGVPWVVRFSLASPWVWLGLFVLGFPLFLPPVVSGLLWGCLCLVGAGRLGPPDAMEWLVVGAACCWRGRFWLLALLLLPPQLLCAVYLGAVQIKVHTHFCGVVVVCFVVAQFCFQYFQRDIRKFYTFWQKCC